MTERTIDGLRIPASIVSPAAADFIEMTRVRNDIEAEGAGNCDLAYEPAELLPGWQNTDYEPRRLFVARLDGRIVGRGLLITAAVEHAPTRRLVAFTELSVPSEPTRPVEQQDTLVLSEHRGRRLGMLAKAANLVRLQRDHPGHPSVTTLNAEENRHMLSVNEAGGFVAVGYEGAWRKTFETP